MHNVSNSSSDSPSQTPSAPHGRFAAVSEMLRQAVEQGVFPGAVLIVGRNGDPVFSQSVGTRSLLTPEGGIPHPMAIDTVFDVAALTNIVVTTTLMMKFVESGALRLEDRVSRYIQGFGVHNKSAITVQQLLNHSAGLAAWNPYFEELLKLNSGPRIGVLTSRGAKEYIYNAINRSHLKYQPDSRQVFSDIGFILLGSLIENLSGLSLDRAAQKHVFQPLGMKSSSYIDLSMIKRRGIHPVADLIAPTEECPWRKRVLCGEVHDDNAWAMGGIAGHSGVFSTALDLHHFAWEMLAAYRGGSSFLRRETVAHFWSRQGMPFEPAWSLGWELPNRENGLLEAGLSENAVGHCGFTGCSLWLEPESGVDIVLMSNRIHPSRSNKKIFGFRIELHRAVLKAIGEL